LNFSASRIMKTTRVEEYGVSGQQQHSTRTEMLMDKYKCSTNSRAQFKSKIRNVFCNISGKSAQTLTAHKTCKGGQHNHNIIYPFVRDY
jgi:hypothetical protein